MHAITVDNISFGYDPAVPVVRDVSLTVRPGEFLSLVGPNGSGKTTLLRLLDRIFIPNRGTILLGEQPFARFSRRAIARRIAFVPQDNSIQFPFTVAEIVLMGRSPHTGSMAFENAHDRDVAAEMMRLTDIAGFADQPVTNLSGGERQRVFIARALAQQPEILLLDEPNAHLDIAHQVEMFRMIKRLNTESGLTVLSVSHDLNPGRRLQRPDRNDGGGPACGPRSAGRRPDRRTDPGGVQNSCSRRHPSRTRCTTGVAPRLTGETPFTARKGSAAREKTNYQRKSCAGALRFRDQR